MMQALKTDRLDRQFNKLFVFTFVAYVFLIEIGESALMDLAYCRIIIKTAIRISFVSIFTICAYNLLRGKYTYKELLVGVFIFVPVIVSVYNCKNADVFMCFVYIFAAKGINIDKVIKYALITMIVAFVVIVLFRIIGVTKEYIYHSVKHGMLRNRYSFGFGYTCVGTIYYLFIVLLYIYVKKNSFNIVDSLIVMFFNVILYLLTFTFNNFFFVVLAVILTFFVKYNKIEVFNKIFAYITIVSAIIGSMLICILTVMYASGNSIALRINHITTGRLKLTLDAIKQYGISIIGNDVKFIGGAAIGTSEYNYVDSMYMQLIIKHGIIVFVIVVVVLTFLSYVAYKKNNKWLLLCYFIINYHATFDDRLINITLNPFLMFFLTYLAYSFDKDKVIISDGK